MQDHDDGRAARPATGPGSGRATGTGSGRAAGNGGRGRTTGAGRRPELPPRTDLTSRWRRGVTGLAVRGERLAAGAKERVLVDVGPPAGDPFARCEDEGLDAHPPGAVLDHREVEIRSLRRVLDVDAWQIRFRTSDVRGRAVAGVTTVMVPRRRPVRGFRPLLSYQCAIDALGPGSDPSYTLRHVDQVELPLIRLALRRGWAVVATDHNGADHAFCAFPLIAHHVLDGIRAALALGPAGLDPAAPIGLWGYSGGALATLFAVERQPGYAPELALAGAAAGGAGVDITSSPEMFDDGGLLSGIPFASLIGVSRGFPDVELRSVLTPQGRAMVDAAADMTMEQIVASFPFVRWRDHLTVPDVSSIPGMAAALEEGRLGRTVPTTELHLYHAVHDRYPPVADVDALVARYRRAGVTVGYARHRVGGHLTSALVGVPGALRFLDRTLGRVDTLGTAGTVGG